MSMYGHHMAPTHHQTTPYPSDALCMHDATCLDTLPSVLVFMVTCGGTWWCQELIGSPGKNKSKIKFCSCPHVRTLYGPRAPPNKPRPFQYALHACCNVSRCFVRSLSVHGGLSTGHNRSYVSNIDLRKQVNKTDFSPKFFFLKLLTPPSSANRSGSPSNPYITGV